MKKNKQHIVAIDLTTRKITGRISFNSVAGASAGHGNNCPYDWDGYSDFDIEADERGLWVIWGRRAASCNIALSKLNVEGDNMFIQHTWFIAVSKRSVGNAFMVCGVLYIIDNSLSDPSFIKYQYDTRTSALTTYTSTNGIQWRNNHGHTTHVHYDSREKILMVWDNGFQTKLPVAFQ